MRSYSTINENLRLQESHQAILPVSGSALTLSGQVSPLIKCFSSTKLKSNGFAWTICSLVEMKLIYRRMFFAWNLSTGTWFGFLNVPLWSKLSLNHLDSKPDDISIPKKDRNYFKYLLFGRDGFSLRRDNKKCSWTGLSFMTPTAHFFEASVSFFNSLGSVISPFSLISFMTLHA